MGLILVANPGSSSRKYALYESDKLALRAELHIESSDGQIVATLRTNSGSRQVETTLSEVHDAPREVRGILVRENILNENEAITAIGLRVVAPGSYFMEDRVISDEVIAKLEETKSLAPIHIFATLEELKILREYFGQTPVVAVSDSAFHRTKPPYAWNYGINIQDADSLEIKRYGYHGISVASAVDELWNRGKLPPKVIVCHLGSGSSVSAIFHGRSIDNTMGFTPLGGVLMATRSGDISPGAVRALQTKLGMDWSGIESYLNQRGGLLGIGGSNDIRDLIEREKNGDHLAHLALTTLVHTIHKAIGSMIATLNGCDLLVFTGTVGERSAILRKRIVAHLEFVDFIIDGNLNDGCTEPDRLTSISQSAKSKPIIVIPTNESVEIAKRTLKAAKR
ncbi:acetate/propionate family kinase [Candidatus Saccharibacteria bacterium oral taxon 955]|nr:acetate/propionate family kinase [Candidatus Saccharibacteria bacterium oral taxon 955]QJU05784.1 acetate/propionate family kinase [Candidatus Saccharibacteria bacterium oral taxon 955]